MKLFFYFMFSIAFTLFNSNVKAQCSTLGQNPWTAFPVCGTTSFSQLTVPLCSSVNLFVPGCRDGQATGGYQNKNPFWYKFTCYGAGNLAFTITPNNLADDYDWQLYDVTGLAAGDVYTNQNIIVSGNWSGSPGLTGASSSGVSFIQCASAPSLNRPRFALSPRLIQGHNYILLVSHFDDTQSGYSISFGGSANITDPLEPRLKAASAPCDGREIRIKLNKKMKCNSLAIDASDFIVITPSGSTLNPSSILSSNCTGSFDFDSLSILMATALAPGTYMLKAKNGTDNNTLQDNCDREIPVDDSLEFTVSTPLPTPMDSIKKVSCGPDYLELVFNKRIKCSSIDPAGSDFEITGPYPITVASAFVSCSEGGANIITLRLGAPMKVAGNFLVKLKTGTDGNTLLNECDVETPLPDDAPFSVYDTVDANFSFSINYGCEKNVVNYLHNGFNTVNLWKWNFTGTNPISSNLQNPIISYANFEPKTIKLFVSNGVCGDSSEQNIIFDNFFKVDFDVSPILCPGKPAIFTNKTIGNISDWQWTMGNGNIIASKNPQAQLYVPQATSDYTVLPELVVKNNYGCTAKISKSIKILYSCFIAVPSAFSPNGDGKNDFLYPLKAYKSSNLNFSIFNRFGQSLFNGNDWQQKWDGKFKGIPQPAGTYVWMLEYTNTDTGRKVFEKGTTILIR